MALNGDNSNEEPIAGAMAIQIALAMDTCLLTIAFRTTVKLLNVDQAGKLLNVDQTATNAVASCWTH